MRNSCLLSITSVALEDSARVLPKQSTFTRRRRSKVTPNVLNSASVGELTGARAALTGLQAKPELNGATGVVKSFSEATGRYAVQLDTGGEPVMVKEANLKRV